MVAIALVHLTRSLFYSITYQGTPQDNLKRASMYRKVRKLMIIAQIGILTVLAMQIVEVVEC